MSETIKQPAIFYCYSIKLKDWLKLNGLYFIERRQHKNGNLYWTFEKNELLDKALTDWSKYKKIFN